MKNMLEFLRDNFHMWELKKSPINTLTSRDSLNTNVAYQKVILFQIECDYLECIYEKF